MTSVDHYRTEAKRCRDLAARAVVGSIMADQWLKIAVEYDTLAEAIERSPLRGRAQQQPMQQQQQKKTD